MFRNRLAVPHGIYRLAEVLIPMQSRRVNCHMQLQSIDITVVDFAQLKLSNVSR
jgi:hypothetical protein